MERVSQTLAANLAELMRKHKFTQVELSKKTQGYVSQSMISKILHGDSAGSDTIAALAKAFGLPMWRLLVDPNSEVVKLADAIMASEPGTRDFIQQIIEREARGPKKS